LKNVVSYTTFFIFDILIDIFEGKIEVMEFLLILVFFIGLLIFFSNKPKIPKVKYNEIFDSCNIANYKLEEGYLSHCKFQAWKNKHQELFDSIKKEHKLKFFSANQRPTVTMFLNNFELSELKREIFNQQFITNELKKYNIFFNNIEGKKLDNQQRVSIIKDEDNNLVIAGAGSGKTSTIVGKVNYIIKRYNVSPEDILVISFTNKSASELQQRINVKGITVNTFHKLGKDIIASVENKQPSIFDENKYKFKLSEFYNSHLSIDEYFRKTVIEFFTSYYKPFKSIFDFNDYSSYIQYISDLNLQTYNNDFVKSYEEWEIANFLFLNSVEYAYEKPYEIDTATISKKQYCPDFSIYNKHLTIDVLKKDIDNELLVNFLKNNTNISYNDTTHKNAEITFNAIISDKQLDELIKIFKHSKDTILKAKKKQRIYLEHFGIDKYSKVPRCFMKNNQTYEEANKEYNDKINWARNIHMENKTILIESYSYEKTQNVLLSNLEQKLKDVGIPLRKKTDKEIVDIIKTHTSDEGDGGLINILSTFITLMKSNNIDFKDLHLKNQNNKNAFIRKRNDLILKMIEPIYKDYEKYLKSKKQIDFGDMINNATSYILDGRYKGNIKYIIIDEFQDISIGRYKLIKAMKSQVNSCKLYVVGDDWQSIYRFTGSDITLFHNFENQFGVSSISKIETTYRFFEPLIELSSRFIQRNPCQIKKELKAFSEQNSTEFFIKYKKDKTEAEIIKNILKELIDNDNSITKKKILIIGRYAKNKDLLRTLYLNNNDLINIKTNTGTVSLTIPFLTAHKSKGLEADIVILLNCKSGIMGFPCEIADDICFNLLLSTEEQFENGEERRLFYVAMTRAKEKLYLVADDYHKSKFIKEVETLNQPIALKRKIFDLFDIDDTSLRNNIWGYLINNRCISINYESSDVLRINNYNNEFPYEYKDYEEKINSILRNFNRNKTNTQKCPNCKTVNIVMRKKGISKNGNKYEFYGCPNYKYGCDYTVVEWINRDANDLALDMNKENVVNSKRKLPLTSNKPINSNLILEDLKKIRNTLAKEQNVPPYFIFSNETLIEIANNKPKNLKEMKDIKGIGNYKLEKYGNFFLETINKYT
jgi:DNA helicase IV